MKQQEKTQRTQERILAAALVEFGEKGYEAASINAICAESQIPKGLLPPLPRHYLLSGSSRQTGR